MSSRPSARTYCADTAHDPGNCGACGHACPPNAICTNGACQGGQQIQFSRYIRPISGTNRVPRRSLGAEIGVMLPIVRAPFRIYYALIPLRLEDSFPGQNLITRSMFPSGDPSVVKKSAPLWRWKRYRPET